MVVKSILTFNTTEVEPWHDNLFPLFAAVFGKIGLETCGQEKFQVITGLIYNLLCIMWHLNI